MEVSTLKQSAHQFICHYIFSLKVKIKYFLRRKIEMGFRISCFLAFVVITGFSFSIGKAWEEEINIKELQEAVDEDMGFLIEILHEYPPSIDAEIKKLAESYRSGDKEKIFGLVHSLLGTSLNVRVREMSQRLLELESYLMRDDLENFEATIPKLLTAFERIKNIIAQIDG